MSSKMFSKFFLNHKYLLTIIVLFLIRNVHSNTFIWDPNNTDNIEMVRPFSRHSTFSNPPKCVQIPTNLTLCHGIKYNEMRLPNLLLHETINEVIEQSNSWIQLIKIGCHPDTQLFLCSLFSPVCLDQTIPPCRSLCEDVKNRCEPSMLRHGFRWPEMMECSSYPINNNMCIESQMMVSHSDGKNHHHDHNQQVTIHRHPIIKTTENEFSDNNNTLHRQLMDAICNADWVIKMGLNQIHDNPVRVKKFKTIFGNLNHQLPFTLKMNKSMIINNNDQQSGLNVPITGKSRQKFIIIGNGDGQEGNGLRVRLAIGWLKNSQQIKKALRRVKNNMGCKKYISSLSTTETPIATTMAPSKKRFRNRSHKKNPRMPR